MESEHKQEHFLLKPKNKIIFTILSSVLGAIGGYLYFYFIGCTTGACPLRANPFYNILMGALIGYLLIDIIIGYIKKRQKIDK
jgi:ABC-type cobalt transport system substrate-binding protein